MDNTNGVPGAEPTPADSARRIKESASTIKDSASTLVERGKDVASQKANEGVERVANSAQNTASALRRAAGDVETDNAWVSAALRKSADGLEQATRSLAGGDYTRGVADLNAFARRQPAIFLGASLALGFALARVGKTAIEAANEDDTTDQYNPYTSSTPGM
jgi:hypothetical protein